ARAQSQRLVLGDNLFGPVGRDGNEEARQGHPAIGGRAGEKSLKPGRNSQVDSFVALVGCNGHCGTSLLKIPRTEEVRLQVRLPRHLIFASEASAPFLPTATAPANAACSAETGGRRFRGGSCRSGALWEGRRGGRLLLG